METHFWSQFDENLLLQWTSENGFDCEHNIFSLSKEENKILEWTAGKNKLFFGLVGGGGG